MTLPRGTTLHMEYTFDNSTNTIANPHHPPQRTVYGPQSSDEMCELWFQVRTGNPEDMAQLHQAQAGRFRQLTTDGLIHRIKIDPGDAVDHVELSGFLWAENRHQEARVALQTALRLDPKNSIAYGHLGFIAASLGDRTEAVACFRKALELNPQDADARQSLQELLDTGKPR